MQNIKTKKNTQIIQKHKISNYLKNTDMQIIQKIQTCKLSKKNAIMQIIQKLQTCELFKKMQSCKLSTNMQKNYLLAYKNIYIFDQGLNKISLILFQKISDKVWIEMGDRRRGELSLMMISPIRFYQINLIRFYQI